MFDDRGPGSVVIVCEGICSRPTRHFYRRHDVVEDERTRAHLVIYVCVECEEERVYGCEETEVQ